MDNTYADIAAQTAALLHFYGKEPVYSANLSSIMYYLNKLPDND